MIIRLNFYVCRLTKYAPNTYTFTKLLAEHVCNDYKNDFDLPIVIYRPSVVACKVTEFCLFPLTKFPFLFKGVIQKLFLVGLIH